MAAIWKIRSIKLIILFINYLICRRTKKNYWSYCFNYSSNLKLKIEVKLIMPRNEIMIDCYIVERNKNFSWFNYFSTTRRLSNGNYREKKKGIRWYFKLSNKKYIKREINRICNYVITFHTEYSLQSELSYT